jgi:large subunit ribosomal protein L9
MKIILKNKIKKLGNIGDVVEVRDGYGKNMLIPNGFALFYTAKNYESFKLKKDELEKENQAKKNEAEDLKSKILTKDLVLIENAGDDGRLYGSISSMKIANFINSLLKTNLKKTNVILKYSIKDVGKYIVEVELHPEVSFEKEIIVARTKEESIKIKKGEKVIKTNEPEKNAEVVASQDQNDVVPTTPIKTKRVKKEVVAETSEAAEAVENDVEPKDQDISPAPLPTATEEEETL